ncbi:type 1 fimbrial protein [Salmonella enterica]|nr:type 1 fimbrial protein [Salmonella enterica]
MKLSKYALLVASGLMVSAGAMAGQTVAGGGTGTVNIDGTIRNATCRVGISTGTVSFEASKADIDSAAAKAVLATMPLTVSVSDCANQGLEFTAAASTKDQSAPEMGHFATGDTDHALGYYVGFKAGAGVTGGDTATVTGTNLVTLDGSKNTPPLILKSTTASASYTINNILVKAKAGASSLAGNNGKVAASYTYTLTYS